MRRILIDMDSITVDLMTPWLREHNARQDDDLTVDRILTWDTHLYAKGGNAIYDVLKKSGLFRYANPLPGAVEAIRTLHERGHEVFMVTAAVFPINFGEKAEWFHEHLDFLGKRRLVFAHEKHLLPGDALIDDGPHNATAYRAAHPGAKILTIGYPYNKDCPAYDLVAGDWRDPAAAWELILKELP